MLGEQGIIPREDAKRIVEGLRGILDDYHAGTLAIDMGAEDVHMFVEALLTDRIGEAGKRLHTGRSRNDQVALDVRMYARGGLPARSGSCCYRCFRCSAPSPRSTRYLRVHARLHAPAKGAAHHAGVST